MVHGTLCERLHVQTSQLAAPAVGETSRIIDARGYNSAAFSLVLVVLHNPELLQVKVQGSNDMENWTDLTTLGSSFTVGFFFPSAASGLQVSYLRLIFMMIVSEPGPSAIVAVNFNLANL